MINKFRKLKISTILIIITIISVVLFIANEAIGNPISAAIAASKIKSYLLETYPNQDFERGKVNYSFKSGGYNTALKSKVSQDIQFSVSYKKGKIFDDYPYEVANKFTTLRRLEKNLDDEIETIVEKEFLYDTRLVHGGLITKDNNYNILTLDMPFDINDIPLPIEVTVWTSSEEISYDILVKRLLELHKIMLNNKIKVDYYSISLEGTYTGNEDSIKMPASGSEEISIHEFPASKITEEGLASILKEHQKQWEESHNK